MSSDRPVGTDTPLARLGLLSHTESVSSVASMSTETHPEPHTGSVSSKLNWLRAGVLGANDGIVSTAGIVVGVAAATTSRDPILTAGIPRLTGSTVSTVGLSGAGKTTLMNLLIGSTRSTPDNPRISAREAMDSRMLHTYVAAGVSVV
jgi:VIT family